MTDAATLPALSAGDTAWTLVATALVLLMVPGLALFYGGLVRSRAALNTFMMSFAALALVSVQWVALGYTLSFAPGGATGDLRWAGLRAIGLGAGPYSATIPHVAFVAFQAMFAGITVALISGAMVERIRFPVYLAFAALWTTLVYDPLAHWVWASDGWLRTLGALDFAGGTVVHVSAGTAALVAATMLGQRRDRGRTALLPHNVPFTLVGAGLLWVGWFGFNAGSALAADGVAANALLTSHTAAASALLVWVLIDLRRVGQATAVGAATGAVVGLVAITPAAGYVSPLAAIVIGASGAGASYAAIQLRNRTRIDDALDVFACHGVAGIVGALLTGVFAQRAINAAGADGLLAGNPRLLGVQAVAVACTIVFAGTMTAVVLKGLALVTALRSAVPNELRGIDLTEHGEHAYHDGDTSEIAGDGLRVGQPVLLTAVVEREPELVRADAA
ncbi:MAG TPA: ammonium transporter [Gemmatimonadaceae bacterium]|nr:ammonium transporter [Gemmatimonadaceae bacterium]